MNAKKVSGIVLGLTIILAALTQTPVEDIFRMFSFGTQQAAAPAAHSLDGFFPVARVVDGDTIRVTMNGEEKVVRMIGVDTPESVHPSKPVECFGVEATLFVESLLLDQVVRVVRDPSQQQYDQYGRALGYVYLPDGTNVAEHIIRSGYGYEYTYNTPYQQQRQFEEAQTYAENNKLGLWAPGVCQ